MTTSTCKTAALMEHYRCAESAAVYRVDDSAKGTVTLSQLRNWLADMKGGCDAKNKFASLPFHPDTAAEYLRHELYQKEQANVVRRPANLNSDAPPNLIAGLVRNTYYLLRPLLPVSLRSRLQRYSLRNWNQIEFPNWPVDCTVELLFKSILEWHLKVSGQQRIPFIWFWPEGRSSCFIMTHDVETRRGLDFCPSVMDMDERYGFRSSFQLVPAGRYHVRSSTLEQIRDRGFEVNIHDYNHDGHLFRNRDEFRKRALAINKFALDFGARGFRSAVLYRNLDWYDSLHFAYDMSVPTVGHFDPQPGGCCSVTPYFIGDIVELPLTTTQDYTLFHILNDYSIRLWVEQIRFIEEAHGLISFIVHPDYVISERSRHVYVELLAHLRNRCQEGTVWPALPHEVNEWWRVRQRLQLTEKNGEWCIEGPGNERARIAWASLQDGKLVYSLHSRAAQRSEQPVVSQN